MRLWYVEVKREQMRFGYVRAKSRKEAIEAVTEAGDGDRDGLSTETTSWQVLEAHVRPDRPSDDEDIEPGAIEIL